jgi:hypothetical protein
MGEPIQEDNKMRRRDLLKAGVALAAANGIGPRLGRADVPPHNWAGYNFGPGPQVPNRLNQGPFGTHQDQGELTIGYTTASEQRVRNFGTGLVGYTWEESGPAVAVRSGKESLEVAVEKLASLPFVDVLYIRCDWRDVQKRPGKLDLVPVWKLTFAAAKRYNLRVGFRIQLSSPNIQPEHLSMPDFLRGKVPIVNIGRSKKHHNNFDFYEPRYDNPEFQKAFRDLTELLAAEFDNNPLVEYMDLMMYGFWGEGHTGALPNPFPDYLTAEKTFVKMTQLQIETFKRTPLAVNTQPDQSKVGNREVQDMAVRAGCWLRSDSIIMEEPIQIEELSNRPPWLAVIMEDGGNRHYLVGDEFEKQPHPGASFYSDPRFREIAALHALDMGPNYWALWTEADNLRRYYERYPYSFDALSRRMGYRVRPSWIWQRKRYDTTELILGMVNDGVAPLPGILGIYVETPDGKVRVGGNLDAGMPYPTKVREASFILPKGLDGKEVTLRAEITTKGVTRPVRWACKEPLNSDGSLKVRLESFDGPTWQRGPTFGD